MKLYTKEQVREMLSMTDYIDIDGDLFTHNDIISSKAPISLPSDEEIETYVKSTGYYGHCTQEYHEGIEEGAKWVIDKIKNQQ